MKIVVPDDYPLLLSGTPAETRLRALGDVTIYTERGANEEDELIRRIAGAEAVVGLRAYSRFSKRVIDASPLLRMISIWGTGTDNVDLDACRARGVLVTNTPGVNANSVAEQTIALMLAVARQIPAMDRGTREGQWPRAMLVQLEGKTLGVVGLGAIGSRVATIAKAFGMKVLATAWRGDDGRAAEVGATFVDLDTLLGKSDFVSIHLRLNDGTRGVLSREKIGLMKSSAFLINTARGAIVDRDALIDALENGRIAGAGLDVFHDEPVRADDEIVTLANVVLTPHNAGTTEEVIALGLSRTVENVERFVASPS